MAISYKAGGNRLSKALSRIFSFILVLFFIFAALLIIALILDALGYSWLLNAIGHITMAIGMPISYIASKVHGFLLYTEAGSLIRLYAPGLIALLFIIYALFKLIFRCYWKLIARPYMVITTIIGFAVFYFITSYFELNAFFLIPLSSALGLLSLIFPDAGASLISALAFIEYFNLQFAFAYFISLWLFSRLTVWLKYSRKMDYILDSDALRIAEEVVKEGKRKSWGIPHRVRFYIDYSDSFNAYAFAHNKIALNKGALEGSDEELIRGVIAHELGHIAHLDVTANTIAIANFNLIFSFIMIPGYFIAAIGPKEGEKVNVFTYLIWIVFMVLLTAIQKIMNSIHYVCYLIGGKKSEYAADKFAVKIGEAKGIMRFMAGFIDVPSGGFNDPHPSMRNRLDHILSWIDHSGNEKYRDIDTDRIRSSLL